MLYYYLATDNSGKLNDGHYDAQNIEEVLNYLASLNLRPISIKPLKVRVPILFFWRKKIRLSDKLFLTKYLSLMLRVGTDLLSAINILISDLKNPGINNFLLEIRENLTKGRPFYEAFIRHPEYFSIVEANIIKAAEISGNLQKTLEDLNQSIEQEIILRNKIRSALIYPVFLLVMSLGIFIFLSTFALPKIAKVFNETGINPPSFSRVVFVVGLFINDNLFYVLLIIIILTAFFTYFIFFSRSGKKVIRQILIRIPFIRKIYQDIALQRFVATFSSLLKAGLPIIDSLKITSSVVGIERLRLAILRIVEEGLSKGLTLGESFKKEIIFPAVIVNLISISEKAGHLTEVLDILSNFYVSNIDTTVKSVVSIIEPVLLILMGGLVGLIALSIIIPIYQLSTQF